MTIRSFQHITAPLRLFSGPDSLVQLGRELDRLNSKRAVIVCGTTLARDGSLELVRTAMGERCSGIVASARTHSPVPAVQAAAEELRRLGADAEVAVGGGSAIVTARAASILLAENADPRTLCTTRDERGALRSPRLAAPKLPQLVIPTTPTTAAVKAGSAIFDPATQERLALFDPKTRAQAIFVHPDMLRPAPRSLIVSAALDTLSLAVEGLTSRSGDPLADAELEHAVRLIAEHLPAGDTPEGRTALTHAAVLGGLGSDHAGAGIATVLGHAIGARHETDNGIVKAIVLPTVIRFNGEAAAAGLPKVAHALGVSLIGSGSLHDAVAAALEALFRALGVPARLRELGLPQQALQEVATHGMNDWFLRGNPRPVREETELLQVLEQAW